MFIECTCPNLFPLINPLHTVNIKQDIIAVDLLGEIYRNYLLQK